MNYFSPEQIKELNGKTFLHPMAHPAYSAANPPVVLTRGEGATVTDIDGHQAIDMVGGLWCVNLGYSCEPIKQAITEQLDRLPFFNCFRDTSNDRAIELGERLREFFEPEQLTTPMYTNSGSAAVDTALRLARQYQHIRGLSGKTMFISQSLSYHGTNCGGASLNGSARFQSQYGPSLPGCHTIPAPTLYRNPFDEDDHDVLGDKVIQILKEQIKILGAENVCAVIMEPVIGSGGVHPPPPKFMSQVRQVCDDNDVLMIADEVITAFGRTGAWTGSRLWGVKPDILTTAKGLTNGYFPMGVTMISEKISQAFYSDTTSAGVISTGYTYSGHPVGCNAALAALAELRRIDLLSMVKEKERLFVSGLEEIKRRHEVVGDVRGVGMMHAVEFVSDRESKTPLDKQSCQKIFNDIYRAGTLVRLSGNALYFSPALVMENDAIAASLEHLDRALS